MKAVVQRVAQAKVTIDGEVSGAIERGLLVYLGVGKGDGERERDWMIDKITGLRIFSNDEGKFDKSVLDVSGKLLVVSQFTLYGDVKKGRRPSFDGAMPPIEAEKLYDAFVARARSVIGVETGRFGAHMMVESINDGPVTILLDTQSITDKTAP
jgi:D-tyrosyl-tRNA(Tyr) deacylase